MVKRKCKFLKMVKLWKHNGDHYFASLMEDNLGNVMVELKRRRYDNQA